MLNKAENILYVIEKLSDVSFQKDVWIDTKYWNRIDGLTEATNTLYEYCFFDDLAENNIGITEYELKVVNTFVDRLLEYDCKDEDRMLLDPDWIVITNEAKSIFDILKKYKW